MTKITRVRVGKTTSETHQIKAIRGLWNTYAGRARDNDNAFGPHQHFCVDPFARNCSWGGKWTNDLDVTTAAHHHMDALEFILKLNNERRTFKIGILDPPFSPRQGQEVYGTPNLYASDSSRLRRIEKAISRLIVPGGYLIKAGYNSNAPARGLDLVELRILCFGGVINDWLISIWRNVNHDLRAWE